MLKGYSVLADWIRVLGWAQDSLYDYSSILDTYLQCPKQPKISFPKGMSHETLQMWGKASLIWRVQNGTFWPWHKVLRLVESQQFSSPWEHHPHTGGGGGGAVVLGQLIASLTKSLFTQYWYFSRTLSQTYFISSLVFIMLFPWSSWCFGVVQEPVRSYWDHRTL